MPPGTPGMHPRQYLVSRRRNIYVPKVFHSCFHYCKQRDNYAYTPCLKKLCTNYCFCQNFVKFPPILIIIIFGRKMAKKLKLCEMHSISTSPNSCYHTIVLNPDVPNCYTTLQLLVLDCSHLQVMNFNLDLRKILVVRMLSSLYNRSLITLINVAALCLWPLWMPLKHLTEYVI